MTPIECVERTCHEPAQFIVKILAFTRPSDSPIELVLGLQVCAKHIPTVDEVIGNDTWDLLDTWALNGRFRLCDRSLTQLVTIPLAGEEGLIMQSLLSNRKKPNG